MRNLKLSFIAILAITALVLSSCYEVSFKARVNQSGKVTGSSTMSLPLNDQDLQHYPVSILNDKTINGPIDVDEISYQDAGIANAEIADCVIGGGITFRYQGAEAGIYTNANYVYDPAGENNKIYVSGYIANTYNQDGHQYITMNNSTVIPESGVAADCALISNAQGGVLYFTGDIVGNFISLGSIRNPVQTSYAQMGINIIQLSHLPSIDQKAYEFLGMFTLGAESADYIESSAYFAENHQCNNALKQKRFNVLNTRDLAAGEFKRLVNKTKNVRLKITDNEIQITCNFQNVDLNIMDRGVNEYEWQTGTAQPLGFWHKSDEGLAWEFRILTNEAAYLNYYIEDTYDNYEVHELDPAGNLTENENRILNYLKQITNNHNYSFDGVVLSTSGDFNKKKNSVNFKNGGSVFTTERDYYYIKDSIKTGQSFVRSIPGYVVKFKANTKKLMPKLGGISKFKKILKKKSVKNIRIIGIYDGTITDEAKASAFEILVQKRVNLVKSKLKKLKIKANVEVGYIVNGETDIADKTAKDKVVIQIVPAEEK